MGVPYVKGGSNISGNKQRLMGLGNLAAGNIAFKRKYRWTMQLITHCDGQEIPEYYVKTANRPQITIEETEINFLHGKFWIPGKATWEAMTITYYDVSQKSGNGNNALFSWLAATYNFTDSAGLHQSTLRGANGSKDGGYGCDGTLTLYDGCGTGLEQWTLNGMWPQSINFGELDYSSSEECTIEVTTRYDTAKYEPLCGGTFSLCCLGCDSDSRPGGVGPLPV